VGRKTGIQVAPQGLRGGDVKASVEAFLGSRLKVLDPGLKAHGSSLIRLGLHSRPQFPRAWYKVFRTHIDPRTLLLERGRCHEMVGG